MPAHIFKPLKQNKMTNQNQIQKLLSTKLDLENFYAIRIHSNDIQLQGLCTRLTKNECEAAGFVFTYDGSYLVSKKDGIEITLTF
jgi:hypothetical protein